MFAACGDDKDDSSSNNGPSRKLLSITRTDEEGTFIQYGNPKWENGRLISFQEGSDAADAYWINYSGTTAEIKCGQDDYDPGLVVLNENGCAILADYGEEYKYSYNSNGQLIRWENSYMGNISYCNISYNLKGDVSYVEYKYSDSYYGTEDFEYTDLTVFAPIPNIGNIMLMNDWRIMTDWEYYYWFGIYGKAMPHLPVRVGRSTFSWTIDDQGYPIKCVVNRNVYHIGSQFDSETYTYNFTWE